LNGRWIDWDWVVLDDRGGSWGGSTVSQNRGHALEWIPEGEKEFARLLKRLGHIQWSRGGILPSSKHRFQDPRQLRTGNQLNGSMSPN